MLKIYSGEEARRNTEKGTLLVRSFCNGILFNQEKNFVNLTELTELMKWYIHDKSNNNQTATFTSSFLKSYYFTKITKP